MNLLAQYKKLRGLMENSDNKQVSKAYLEVKRIERGIFTGNLSFVTMDSLFSWTKEWIKSFPESYDIIVGIPRSGLCVATIIALKLGKPLSTPEDFIKNKKWVSKTAIDRKIESVLLVDDSFTTGTTLTKQLTALKKFNPNLKITTASLIVTPTTTSKVDLYYKIIPHPRLFEWNLLHAKKGKTVSDLDGVLCENCPQGIEGNEKQYLNWIKTAKPHLIPAFELDAIHSCRLEKYRQETENWLEKNKVRYKKLILWNLPSKDQRNGKHAEYKITNLLKLKPDLVFESSSLEAKKIWAGTHIPVLCVDEMELMG